MRLSIVTGLDESNTPPGEVAKVFEERVAFLRGLGFQGVELAALEPEKLPASDLLATCESHGLAVSAVGTGSTFLRFGYNFGTSDGHLREKALDRVREYAKFASEFDAKVVLGLIRGRYRLPDTRETALEYILECTRECGPIADEYGVDMVVEPINRFEIDSLNTVGETAEFLEQVGHPRVKLMVDNFHVNLEESREFVEDELAKYVPFLAHVHLADTDRRAPGSGTFDYATFLGVLKSAGYGGFLSVEPIMKPSFEVVAELSAETILPLVNG
ncbi:MAG: sugar phosphate isomerase/epimerase family protein [Promethearchaeota archaeon]